MQYQETMNKYD